MRNLILSVVVGATGAFIIGYLISGGSPRVGLGNMFWGVCVVWVFLWVRERF